MLINIKIFIKEFNIASDEFFEYHYMSYFHLL